jgi:hypothetical protein
MQEALLTIVGISEKHGRFLLLEHKRATARVVAYSLSKWITTWLLRADEIHEALGPDVRTCVYV